MSKWGVSSKGFIAKPFEVIRAEIEEDLRLTIHSQMKFSATSVAGQLVGIFAAKIRELWEVAADVSANLDPDVASNRSLTSLASLTGTIRKGSKKSVVAAAVELEPNTTLPAGSVASVKGYPRARFATLKEVTNNTGKRATFNVELEAEESGPLEAPVGELTVIETPKTGWVSIINPKPALVGRFVETDAELRIRRIKELRAPGSGSLDALRAKLLALPQVRSALILENNSNYVDERNVPPHAFEVMVLGGEDRDIARVIWENKPVGILTHGGQKATVQDSQGRIHDIRFSRPEIIPLSIYLEATGVGDFSEDRVNAIKKTLVEYTRNLLGLGENIAPTRLYGPVFRTPGIVDIKKLIVFEKELTSTFTRKVLPHQWLEFAVSRIDIRFTFEGDNTYLHSP